jgi:ABC-2 type transport system permease protein
LTEHSLVAIAALLMAVITSEVMDNIPQLGWLAPYLPTHWWVAFDALLRAPADTATVGKGLASFGVYLAMAVAFAWARFGSADVTS